MKRVIDGLTYNTDTSNQVATYEYEDDKGYEVTATLYQTRGGAFFIVHQWGTRDRVKEHFEPISRDDVARLIAKADNLTILDSAALEEPPEAAAEGEPGSTLYVRIPSSLKRRVDEAADEAKVSGNTWAMRCMERCLSFENFQGIPELASIWYLAATVANQDTQAFSQSEALRALSEIAQLADRLSERLVGNKATDNLNADDPLVKDIAERYRPHSKVE